MPRLRRIGLAVVMATIACRPPMASQAGGDTSTSSGGESTSTSTDGSDVPEQDCGTVVIETEYFEPILMFVVDSSPSMLASWDHDGDPNTAAQTRWATAHQVLEAIGEVASRYALVGLQRFPAAAACPSATPQDPTCTDASACTVASAPELGLISDGFAQLSSVIPSVDAAAIEFAGGSPAAAAYASALAEVLADPHDDYRAIILLTDGHINCGAGQPPDGDATYDDSLRELIESAWLEHDVRTFVIAIDERADPSLALGPDAMPGFDPRPALHELGVAGGGDMQPAYLRADDPYLARNFETEDGVLSCVIDLGQTAQGAPTPEQVPLVSWMMNGEPVPYVERELCDSESGWTWIVDDDTAVGETALFCGQACELFKQDGTVTIATYGCPLPP